ncbi:hypothetical protein HYV89_04725 [Candidatus Woesearchaeota archaeon]|nr:hypothetical protein [Candidatus Woesearchaeota archaeon]
MVSRLNKKGIAITFDWMFSIVAGVLIFSFLIYFAVQNTDLFGKVTARIVSEELDILFSGYETAQVSTVLDFGREATLDFRCDEINKRQKFMINDREGKNLWGKIIFAPKNVKSDKINVATASWNAPFRVANFVYLWDKRYLLDYDSDLELPEWVNPSASGDINIKFARDSSLALSSSSSFDCSYNFRTSNNEEYDKVIYYDKNPSDDDVRGYVCFKGKEKSFFYGEAMMIGAIFSESKIEFDCVKDIAVDRLKIVNDIYTKKVSNLIISDRSCNPNFGASYNNAVHEIDNNGMLEKDFDSFDFGYVNRIRSANQNLISTGCAGVY